MKRILTLSLLAGLFLASCKKDNGDDTPPPSPPVSEADKIKDTSLLIAREAYLWYNKIPANMNPRQYADPDKVMQAIRPYSIEPGFSDPVDRWSFAMLQAEWDDVSSGISGDFGLGIFFRTENDLRVTYVEPESSAGKAGIQRAWQILKINDRAITVADDATIDFIIDAIYYSTSAKINFKKSDGTTADITLNTSTYQEQPLVLDTVYTTGGKKIGYLVLNSFLGDQNTMKNRFQQTFADFAAAGVTDLVVDVRYNGGGYVVLQEELANYIAPTAANNQTMYTQQYNEILKEFNRTVKFAKKGTVNVPKMVMIISRNTASASEALINLMKPHMEVKTIGPSTTNGKPVGYFPIPVGDWYVFPVSSRLVNSQGQGSYFNGFTPDKLVADGLDKPWGDLTESCLAAAVNYLTTGALRAAGEESFNRDDLRSYEKLPLKKMKVLIDEPHSLSALKKAIEN